MHSLRPWLIAALALPVASAAPSGFDVRVNDGLVTIDAREVPLSDVLDQLGRQTGMKLVYEAGRPRQIVSAVIEGVSPPVAVARLLEGLGVGYGFSLDPTGTRVETLLISGVTAAVSTSARPALPAPRSSSTTRGSNRRPKPRSHPRRRRRRSRSPPSRSPRLPPPRSTSPGCPTYLACPTFLACPTYLACRE